MRQAAGRVGDRRPPSADYRLGIVTDAHEYGGAEKFLRNLLHALPPGVEVVVMGTTRPVLDRVVANRPGARTVQVENTVAAYLRALLESRPDVVHLNLASFTSCRAAALACTLWRVPFLLVDHLPTPGLTWRGRTLQRVLTRSSVERIAVGRSAARLVERYGGLRQGAVGVIPNGVPSSPCHAAPPPSSPFVLGVLARLEHQKGLDVLLRALTHLPTVVTLIGGAGSERGYLERLAAELGLEERVSFLGQVDDPCEVLARSHVLVLPSRWEAMPLSVLEAMHNELPVVVTDVGSLREVVVPGETGFIVPPEDPGALVAACAQLAADAVLRRRMGQVARARAEKDFSVEAMATRYDARYRTALRLPPHHNARPLAGHDEASPA